jgi:hypothetical protein
MRLTETLANDTSQELGGSWGGSCANTRDSDIRVVGVAASYGRCMQRRRNRLKGTPNRARRSTDNLDAGQFDDPEWAWVGDRRMLVVGHTPGGAPFGCFEDELEDLG